jgi:signal transduction histidine kinase
VDFVEYDGKPAMIGIFRDISERKKMEQRMRESERLASIGQLAAAIAHEIRNPLSAIKMNIQILSRNLKLREFDKRRLEIATGEIKRLERIVEDVLDFARPLQMNKTSCSVNEVLRKCFDLLHDSIPHKNIQVIKKMSRVLKNVSIDSEMMEQAFLNIILNAIDAMPRGGTLEIVTRKTERAGREMVLVDFQDSGMGMNQEQLAKAFDPFYTTKTMGVGLGLSNVKKIIEAHEGIIEVESHVAQGSTFRILLPSE